MKVEERFLKYVGYHTTSDENSESTPSTERQLLLANELCRELFELGLLLFALAVEERATLEDIFFDLCEMAFENQGKTESVAVFVELLEVVLAEALFIRLDTDIRLHHGGTHDDFQLVFLQHILQKTEGTIVGFSVDGVFKRFVDRYGINFFSHGVILSPRP